MLLLLRSPEADVCAVSDCRTSPRVACGCETAAMGNCWFLAGAFVVAAAVLLVAGCTPDELAGATRGGTPSLTQSLAESPEGPSCAPAARLCSQALDSVLELQVCAGGTTREVEVEPCPHRCLHDLTAADDPSAARCAECVVTADCPGSYDVCSTAGRCVPAPAWIDATVDTGAEPSERFTYHAVCDHLDGCSARTGAHAGDDGQVILNGRGFDLLSGEGVRLDFGQEVKFNHGVPGPGVYEITGLLAKKPEVSFTLADAPFPKGFQGLFLTPSGVVSGHLTIFEMDRRVGGTIHGAVDVHLDGPQASVRGGVFSNNTGPVLGVTITSEFFATFTSDR